MCTSGCLVADDDWTEFSKTCFLPSLKNVKDLQLLILPIDNPEKATLHHDLVQGISSKISKNFTNVFQYIFSFSLKLAGYDIALAGGWSLCRSINTHFMEHYIIYFFRFKFFRTKERIILRKKFLTIKNFAISYF